MKQNPEGRGGLRGETDGETDQGKQSKRSDEIQGDSQQDRGTNQEQKWRRG